MQTYNASDFTEDSPPVFLPAVVLDHTKIVLADKRPAHGATKQEAVARILQIFHEEGGVDMDCSAELHPEVRLSLVGRFLLRIRLAASRWFLWNVRYPVTMWFHFRFHREKPLPTGTWALRAMLREAFAAEGINDHGLPYPIEAVSPLYKAE